MQTFYASGDVATCRNRSLLVLVASTPVKNLTGQSQIGIAKEAYISALRIPCSTSKLELFATPTWSGLINLRVVLGEHGSVIEHCAQ